MGTCDWCGGLLEGHLFNFTIEDGNLWFCTEKCLEQFLKNKNNQ